jgi:hypothetical protein
VPPHRGLSTAGGCEAQRFSTPRYGMSNCKNRQEPCQQQCLARNADLAAIPAESPRHPTR